MHVLNNNIKYTSTILRRKSVKKPHLWQWILNNKYQRVADDRLTFFSNDNHNGKVSLSMNIASFQNFFNLLSRGALLLWLFLEYINLLKMKSSLFSLWVFFIAINDSFKNKL